MKHRLIAGLVAAAALLGLTACAAGGDRLATAARQPNVIIILADDLGYGDTSAYGGPVPTPNLEALAASGVKFTSGYVAAAVCAPSRAALMSGRSPTRYGFEFNPVGRDELTGLALTETTVAQLMKRAGYATAMVGKWHIGQAPGYHPLDRGFDSYFGLQGGATDYITRPADGDISAKVYGDAMTTRAAFPVYRGRQPVDEPRYLTEAFTEEARGFIRANRDRPFFLYLAYTAPHTPLQATRKYADRFPNITSPYKRAYAALVSSLDDGIGEVMAELRAQGLERDTVVIFLSDNGCAGYINGGCTNAPLEGAKATPWEGGIRVPFVISAPGRLPAGRVESRAVSSLDILPTVVRMAGATPPPSAEGRDLAAALAGGRSSAIHPALFWRMGPNHAVREGRWKLLVVNRSAVQDDLSRILGSPVPDGVQATIGPLGQWVLLFDLQTDPGESRDVAALHPDVVRRLAGRFDQWDQDNVAPMFTSRRQVQTEIGGRGVQLFN